MELSHWGTQPEGSAGPGQTAGDPERGRGSVGQSPLMTEGGEGALSQLLHPHPVPAPAHLSWALWSSVHSATGHRGAQTRHGGPQPSCLSPQCWGNPVSSGTLESITLTLQSAPSYALIQECEMQVPAHSLTDAFLPW